MMRGSGGISMVLVMNGGKGAKSNRRLRKCGFFSMCFTLVQTDVATRRLITSYLTILEAIT
jgi:hypothetical protein